VISSIEPVYLERLAAHGSRRRIVPLSQKRRVRLKTARLEARGSSRSASGRLARWARDRFAAGRHAGSGDFVAAEQIETLAQEIARGAPVFLDASFTHPADRPALAAFAERFALTEPAPKLFELRLR
jgi:hypothetical protein